MKEELLKLIFDKGFKYSAEEGFKLASGKMSKFYVDCRIVTSLAKAKYLMAHLIYPKLAGLEIEAIGGPAIGAIPIADAVSFLSYLEGKEIKSFWIRQTPKDHGLKKWVEGDVQAGDRVVIVDDVITTGKSTIEAIQRAREAGLNVVKAIALVDRQEDEGRKNIEKEGVEVDPLFTIADLMTIYQQSH